MEKNGKMTLSEDVEVDITVTVSDVETFIKNHATPTDISILRRTMRDLGYDEKTPMAEGSLVRSMKAELLNLAANTYTLEELERRLGTQFDLI